MKALTRAQCSQRRCDLEYFDDSTRSGPTPRGPFRIRSQFNGIYTSQNLQSYVTKHDIILAMNTPPRTTTLGVPFTELALKYTHPIGRLHKVLAGTGKSGLTPIASPQVPNSPNQQRQNDRYERHQRSLFFSFSTQELVKVQAFAPSYFYFGLPTNNPINPLFERRKWNSKIQNSVPFQILPGNLNGYYQVSCRKPALILWLILYRLITTVSGISYSHL